MRLKVKRLEMVREEALRGNGMFMSDVAKRCHGHDFINELRSIVTS